MTTFLLYTELFWLIIIIIIIIIVIIIYAFESFYHKC